MASDLSELLASLSVDRIEDHVFLSHRPAKRQKRAFGGELLGQALAAAYQTVEARSVHSLHAYFVRPGDASAPIRYRVDRLRDGNAFSLRQVQGFQDDKLVLSVSCSFSAGEGSGEEHQPAMPSVPAPDELENQFAMANSAGDPLSFIVNRLLRADQPFEFRLADLEGMVSRRLSDEARHFWFRVKEKLPDAQSLHHSLLAYASDIALIDVALHRHGYSLFDGRHLPASLDHAIWFHRPFRMDEWLLYSQESPSMAKSRSLLRGSIHALNGDLIASVSQEGLLRLQQ